ncbi:MAG: alpha/beta hydrolase family protein [Litorimonas sp.]
MRRLKRGLAALSSALILSVSFANVAQAAPDAALFGQLPQAHDAAISPDGNQIAILQNFRGSYLVNIVDLGESTSKDGPRFVRLEEGVEPDYIKWIDDHRVIVSVHQTRVYEDAGFSTGYLSDMSKETVISTGYLYLVDTNTLKANIVVKPGKRSLRQFNNEVLDWLEDDPDHIIMQFADDGADQTFPNVQKVNVNSGKSKTLKHSALGVNSWVTDASGIPRVGVGYERKGKDAFIQIQDPETGEWETADHYPGIDPETMSVVAVTDNGRSLIMSAYRGRDTRGLHRYDLIGKAWAETLYQNDEYDVRGVILSKDGNRVLGAQFTGETTERVLFDEFDGTYEEALATFEGYETRFVDQSSNSNEILIHITAPSEPGGLYLFERGGQLTPILDNFDGLTASDMGEVIALRYTARDGEKIPAFVTLPPSIRDTSELKNVPSIVLPHGGPYSRDAKRFDWLAQFFASRGYLVLQMNFRGSAGYGKSFADAGRDSWVVMQEDVEDGMRWLLEKGYADPDKTCIAGWSYGGYAALMGAAKTPDLYQCSIAIAALSDIPEAIRDAEKYVNGKAHAKRTFGTLMDDRSLMQANNPVDHADKIQVPVFLAHGELDAAVEYDQFESMRRRLKKAGADGTYMSFEDEDHYMSNQANRQAMLEGMEAFLLKVNGESPFMVD